MPVGQMGSVTLIGFQVSDVRFQISDFRYQKPDIRHLTSDILLTIHDLSGRLVRSLPITEHQTLNTEVTWDGRDSQGKKVNSGVYFYSIKHKDSGAKGKFVILK